MCPECGVENSVPVCAKEFCRTDATSGGFRLLTNRKMVRVRLPGWLQKYGAGLKRLLARYRSLGNMLLSGAHGWLSNPSGLRFYSAPALRNFSKR
jgi:hypothetical protein